MAMLVALPLQNRCSYQSIMRARLLHAAAPVYDDGLFAVAPMMDYTDRFLRFMIRQITLRATLYTEMVTANTIAHCTEQELPRFLASSGPSEQPLVLQIGGSDPELIRRAAARAASWDFTAMNLNCGCPSDRVAGSGCFGAALMREPERVGDLCSAMTEGVGGRIPVTVKCRIGVTSDRARAAQVDDEATYEELARFIDVVSTRGHVSAFQIHARKAVLGGLSPAQNRKVPPLRYNLVHQLAADFPNLRFSLNGGILTLDEAIAALSGDGHRLSGVMVGRAVVERPWEWAQLDSRMYGELHDVAACRRQVLHKYAAFADAEELAAKQRIRRLLLAPALNLFAGEPNGKIFRREVDTLALDDSLSAGSVLLRSAEAALSAETLDAPPGYVWDKHEKVYKPPSQSMQTSHNAHQEMLSANVSNPSSATL